MLPAYGAILQCEAVYRKSFSNIQYISFLSRCRNAFLVYRWDMDNTDLIHCKRRTYCFPEIYEEGSHCNVKSGLLEIKINKAVKSLQNEINIRGRNWFAILVFFGCRRICCRHCNQADFLFKQHSILQSDTFNVILLLFHFNPKFREGSQCSLSKPYLCMPCTE